jgi:hypothetical protein
MERQGTTQFFQLLLRLAAVVALVQTVLHLRLAALAAVAQIRQMELQEILLQLLLRREIAVGQVPEPHLTLAAAVAVQHQLALTGSAQLAEQVDLELLIHILIRQ